MAERLTFEGNFCEIARCRKTRLGKHCPDGDCSQRKVWERLKQFEDSDAVPVVRCRDCKHFKRNLENDTYCSSVNGLTDPEEDDFCSYGERKEGADNDQA